MSYIVFQKGGYDKVGFTSKDLHNHISKTRRGKVKDGDAFAVLAYLFSKADSDPLFLGKFTLKDGRLDNLVWADGESVIDYECFGDVLAFDTTYKKNVYNKPLVIFSGTNHHGQTTIFGCALLSNERSETLKVRTEGIFGNHVRKTTRRCCDRRRPCYERGYLRSISWYTTPPLCMASPS
ncbi:hypothetical protein AHAS_Ahas11G0324600 [Arachis hypogaea]